MLHMFKGILLGLLLSLGLFTNTYAESRPLVISYPAWQSVKYFPTWHEQNIALDIFYCESTWNPHAIGYAGERGIPQIHPIHFEAYSVDGDQLAHYPDIAGYIAYKIYL